MKGENPSRPVDVRYSKTPLLKLPSVCDRLSFLSLHYAGLEATESLARICQMLPGNSNHPSLYPILDSVPCLRPRVRLGPSCRTALWDCLGDAIAFLLALIRMRRRSQNRSLGAKWSRGTKTRRTAWDAVGEENKEILLLERQFPFCSATHFVVCPPERYFCTVWLFSCKGPIPRSKQSYGMVLFNITPTPSQTQPQID